jgi:hypothetical protein
MKCKTKIISPPTFDGSCLTQQFLSFTHYSNSTNNKKGSYLGLSEHMNIQMDGLRKTTDTYDVMAGLHAGIR